MLKERQIQSVTSGERLYNIPHFYERHNMGIIDIQQVRELKKYSESYIYWLRVS
jgi:hypothetical protein